eukprot:gnl/Ergobibamus_cyprinoides/2598.p1 GENE.gnl/Ergobibamus_cyprinoides/2598~~gnl/Ergobibamus_cyprinoides/2598.p1  ORF type:complete len:153 (+),score=40.60 gnl/Ergobibamus_cyprinoides/2598:153-611(+)
MEHEITLLEALTGFEFSVKQLDGRTLAVRSRPSDGSFHVISDGDIKAIEGEGMPVHQRPYQHGKMYIMLKVRMPTASELSPAQMDGLRAILPRPKGRDAGLDLPDAQEVHCHHLEAGAKVQATKASAGRAGQAYDEDDGDQARRRAVRHRLR